MIVYVDRSEIGTGNLEQVKMLMTELAQFVEGAEPQLISYSFFLDETEHTMTVVAVHPDSASMELHMNVAGEEFRKFAGLITLRSIDVYGQPSAAVVELLEGKARMLGTGSVHVHHEHAGFTRLRHPQATSQH